MAVICSQIETEHTIANPSVKCVITNREDALIGCSAGTPGATKEAQVALITKERDRLNQARQDGYTTDDPMHLWMSKYCEFTPAGKAYVAVEYRKATPEEKRVCRIQHRPYEHPGDDLCSIIAISEQQTQYRVSCK